MGTAPQPVAIELSGIKRKCWKQGMACASASRGKWDGLWTVMVEWIHYQAIIAQ